MHTELVAGPQDSQAFQPMLPLEPVLRRAIKINLPVLEAKMDLVNWIMYGHQERISVTVSGYVG